MKVIPNFLSPIQATMRANRPYCGLFLPLFLLQILVKYLSLSVSAKSRLSLHADRRVQVDAGSAIYLHAGGSSLVLDGETDLRSAQVKLEGTVKRPVFVADLEPIWE